MMPPCCVENYNGVATKLFSNSILYDRKDGFAGRQLGNESKRIEGKQQNSFLKITYVQHYDEFVNLEFPQLFPNIGLEIPAILDILSADLFYAGKSSSIFLTNKKSIKC